MSHNPAAEFFVAPNGSDTHSGTREQPFLTPARARQAAREAAGAAPVTVTFRGGIYFLPEPLILTPEDSGGPDAPVVYTSFPGETVVLSGGVPLCPEWTPHEGAILKTRVPEGFDVDQLFLDGQQLTLARYPNYDPDVLPYNGYAAEAFDPERAAAWRDPEGGFIHAIHRHKWGGYHYRITGKEPNHTVIYEGGWQNNRQMGMHPDYRFVENIFEELDAPGEWFLDRKTRTLYLYPPETADLEGVRLVGSHLRHVVEVQGTQADPVRHVEISGLIFRHTRRTFMETREPLLRSDWTIYRGGALLVTGAEDLTVKDCEFHQLGGNAVFLSTYNRRVRIAGTHIHDIGASGVCFVGSPDAVRNPLFEYKERQNVQDIDNTPGPKSDNFPLDCGVEDSLIHSVSLVEKQAAGVQISMSRGITVRHCSIYDSGRAGINISEGTFGGHLIEFCDVFDTVRETGDHGSFNSWGRDRFWELRGAPEEELPELARLDTRTTLIRNSRWRCDHGWDIDLDDGSSDYEITNNLMLNGGLKLREGFYRKATNNITVNNGLHPHVWYADSHDVVKHNIFMTAHRPVRVREWGDMVDENFFTSEQAAAAHVDEGVDTHSAWGDPLFVDPANGDYRVKPGSPALKVGFENFPMDRFGVQKPELRAIARVPEFPVPVIQSDKGSIGPESTPETWWGAKVKALEGGEFSAFGVSEDEGGVHVVEIPEGSGAARAGLRTGDLIQQVNGSAVDTVEALKKQTLSKGVEGLTLGVVRSQEGRILKVEREPGNL